jgi:hypothetical protein
MHATCHGCRVRLYLDASVWLWGSPTGAAREARSEVNARIAQAVLACHSQPFRTSVARAQCHNQAEAQARPFSPYPDLLDERLAVRLALAERMDRNQLSESEAQRALARTMARLHREQARRTAIDLSGSAQDRGVARRGAQEASSRKALQKQRPFTLPDVLRPTGL